MDASIPDPSDEIGVLQSRLTESENKRLSVQITGKNGTPIYYEESFRNAKQYDDDDGGDYQRIFLSFDDGNGDNPITDGFPLSSLDEIEIRLGGVRIQRFNIDDLTIHFRYDAYDDDNHQMECITLKHIHPRPNGNGGPITGVRGIYGPLPLGWRQGQAVGDNPFLADLGWGQELAVEIEGRELAGREMLLTDFFKLVADENNGLTPQTLMVISELIFDKKDIIGIMSLINEETPHHDVRV
ncbi:hypothetical protein FRACYDRAFT_244856 [Fragilariopsis cylindrus CCMP1102]|uniref:Uncharacterized protein n=1 Tax=Fragilariopsis cylindrus CCMP1102 TaxID=635003 RepID=A0A1E7F0X0_9STRA|nr:hypothetical protein FRACYDRAFT_244856 [Fragilariopsis cylindrus CCMP1102]|eukprot:OEU11734.1 hypothetical protein FRACYDRAFT_244856 [Fragilariopsis cylindrus CCMP1102]